MNVGTIQNALKLEKVELLRAGNASVEALTSCAKSDVLVLHTKDGGTVHVWHDNSEAPDDSYHRLIARVVSRQVEIGQIQDR